MDLPTKPRLLQSSIALLPGSTRTDGNEADVRFTKSNKVVPDDSEKPESTEVNQQEDLTDQSSAEDSDSDSDIKINQSPIEETPKVIPDTDRNRRSREVLQDETNIDQHRTDDQDSDISVAINQRPAAVKDIPPRDENPPRNKETAIGHRDFGQSPTDVKDHGTTTVTPPRNEETPKDNPNRNRKSREVLQDETNFEYFDQQHTDYPDFDINVVIKQRSIEVNQLEDVTGQSSTEDPDNDFEIDQRPAAVKNNKTRDEDPPRNEETAVVNLDIGQSPTYVKDQCTRSEKPPRNEATPKDNPDRNQRKQCVVCFIAAVVTFAIMVALIIWLVIKSVGDKGTIKPFLCGSCDDLTQNGTIPDLDQLAEKWKKLPNSDQCCFENSDHFSDLLESVFQQSVLHEDQFNHFNPSNFTFSNISLHRSLAPNSSNKEYKVKFFKHGLKLEFLPIDLDKNYAAHERNLKTDKDGVTIKDPGIYFIYISILFFGNNKPCTDFAEQTWYAYVKRRRSGNDLPETLLACSHTCKDVKRETIIYCGRLFDLKKGDKIEIYLSGMGLVAYNYEATFFGLAMM